MSTLPVGETTRSERVAATRDYLMCRPEHFTVSYRINPWMHPAEPTDTALALRQWQELHDTYLRLGHRVRLIDQRPDSPDMVYTANGGFVVDGVAYVPRFRHAERSHEEGDFADWFRAAGLRTVEPEQTNEGEGDFLLVGDTILAGTGFRSDPASHDEVRAIFGREVVSLTLVDPRFYHLDTAISVLDPVTGQSDANIAYLPGAFDAASRAELERRYPDAILVDDEDAQYLGLNSISDGRHVIISPRATGFEASLRSRGYEPIGVDLSELLRGGGGIKCCTLEIRS